VVVPSHKNYQKLAALIRLILPNLPGALSPTRSIPAYGRMD